MEDNPIESFSFEAWRLGEVLDGVFESSKIVESEDLPSATLRFKNEFKETDGAYNLSVDQLYAFVQSVENDAIDKVCLSLVDKGLVNMSCDDNGEFNYELSELGKVVNVEKKPKEQD